CCDSQMAGRIDPLVEYPDDIDRIVALDGEQQVAAVRVSTVALADVVHRAATGGIGGDSLDRSLDLADVDLGLLGIPAFQCEVSDRGEISLGRRSEAVPTHAILPTTKVSKSNGSASPLSSPAASAERSAAICVSRSSRGPSIMRMTRLLDRSAATSCSGKNVTGSSRLLEVLCAIRRVHVSR